MTRILIAGFQHETNTFGASKATFEDFLEADGWPGLLQGNEIITGTEGINLPVAGLLQPPARFRILNYYRLSGRRPSPALT